jgi:repressor LexA
MSVDLPPRQKEVLRLIQELTDQRGFPPTLADLAKAMGLRNRMTVHQHVVALKNKGMVQWEPGLNRSLRVIADDENGEVVSPLPRSGTKGSARVAEPGPRYKLEDKQPGLPLLGAIAAGTPIDAIQVDEYLEVESQYANSGCYALKVKGESMIDDGIFDGDFVIVKPKPVPKNGEIAVCLTNDGATTLKRFFKEKNRFRLQPANSSMKPIYVDSASDLNIQGVVVALFRKM